MPIEVRELIIKATIQQDGAPVAGSAPSSATGNNNVSPNEEIINTCIEKVLEIIKDKNGR